MSTAVPVAEMAGDDDRWCPPVAGAELIAQHQALEQNECAWLEALARFDQGGEWAMDGMASCASWLTYKLKMGRSTAHEKTRVARQLLQRSVVAAAFRDGRISYSAARTITRVPDLDPDTDQALVDLAIAGTVADLERMVHHIELLNEQDTPPAQERTGLTRHHLAGGLGRLELTRDEVDIDEVFAAIETTLAARHRRQATASESSAEDSTGGNDGGDDDGGASSESSAEDSAPRWGPAARADAFMDLVRAATSAGDGEAAGGADRYLTHIVIRPDGHATLADGTPISDATADMVACDTSLVSHLIGPNSEPLALGRRQRAWSSAQRRAAHVRDQSRCRWPGCDNHIVDLHHQHWWDHGGATDLVNGFLICRRHHRLIHHQRYQVTGNPNAELTFHRPDGATIGVTSPPQAELRFLEAA